MSQINRLPDGGRIDRAKTIGFWYDERKYQGHPGDTLASALLANGVMLVARSFKYHRPRGIFSAGAEEPNALVQLERGAFTEPNRRATEIEIYDGLVARSQNCWPSVRFDLGAVASLASRILPAGFYYKTFMHPRALWMTYEKYIRKAAGLGRAPRESDPDSYDKTHAHCDVLIIGAGPAGLAAACAAGATGARVIIADERSEFGGSMLDERRSIDGDSNSNGDAEDWIAARVKQLAQMEQVTMLPRTTVTGCYDYNFAVACERVSEHLGPAKGGAAPKERLWKIRAKRIVVATGSIERPLVFADNDRPGVMLAGAMRAYLNRFGVRVAKRIAVLTNNDSAYRTALDAHNAGATVEVIDVRAAPVGELVKRAREMGIRIHFDNTVSAVRYARGRITGVTVMALSADGDAVRGDAHELACDAIAVSGGWTPTVHLLSQAKIDLVFSDRLHCFLPQVTDSDAGAPLPNPRGSNAMFCAGACRGAQYLDECLAQGTAAGIGAAAAAGFSNYQNELPRDDEKHIDAPRHGSMRALWILPCDHPIGRGPKKHFHELHNDSTIADIELAAREGFAAPEHLKRYTTTGMGTDQGKTSNLNALAALATLSAVATERSAMHTTTFRPPYTPLTFGAIVGHERRELFLQQRTTPMHPWHDRRGAVYEDVGDWKRPRYFPSGREDMHAAVQRECLAVRNAVGILDASTLGKIDIQGADASAFLNMLYTNAWSKLAVGACRYGLMLNEHGMVFDDGVTTRLGDNHYHMTTTTGGAARVLNWLEEWLQTEWQHLQVYCTSVTEQWAVASINGPKSRALLAELCDKPIDNESFPFMTMQTMQVAGIPARVFRISFTGELAFEINVPARYGLALWRALMRAGERHGICPYGTEAMHVLRAEKGFIIVGQDTDGTVTPHDLGMDWIVSKTKDDFIGKRSLSRSDTARNGRKQLVGLLTEDPYRVLPEGAHAVVARRRPPMEMIGHVSSSYMSPNFGRSIALALIADGLRRKGERIEIALDGGSTHRATIVDSVFIDPTGERARG